MERGEEMAACRELAPLTTCRGQELLGGQKGGNAHTCRLGGGTAGVTDRGWVLSRETQGAGLQVCLAPGAVHGAYTREASARDTEPELRRPRRVPTGTDRQA